MPTSLMDGAFVDALVVVGGAFVLFVLYAVARAAVRDGIIEARRREDANQVRSELRLGPERSPNSRP